MKKQEFIDKLKAALNGRVAPGVVMENVNFYEEYINTEIRKGRDEEEILQTLGDPRLIARTIIDTYRKENGAGEVYEEQSYSEGSYQEAGYGNTESRKPKTFHMQGWMWVIILILVFVLVISFIFSVVSFLLPILLPILVVVFLVKLFRDWLN